MELHRLSKEVFDKCDNVKDLWEVITNNGRVDYIDVGDLKTFKSKVEFYKSYLKKELPDYSFEEILKFDKDYHRVKNVIYDMDGYENLLAVIELECLKGKL